MGQAQSFSVEGFPAVVVAVIIIFLVLIILFIAVSPIFVIAALLKRKAEYFKNQRISTVIAQYDPPYELRPAEVGFLYDMRCDKKELWATLFDLHERCAIRFSGNGIRIVDQEHYKKLAEFEKMAIHMVSEQTPVPTSAVQRFTIFEILPDGTQRPVEIRLPQGTKMGAFTRLVQQSLRTKGYATRRYVPTVLLYSFLLSIVVAALPTIAIWSLPGESNGTARPAWGYEGFLESVFFAFILGLFVWPAYLAFSAFVIHLWGKIAGRYWLNTSSARKIWPELEGYKRFLGQVEVDNVQYASRHNDLDAALLSALPYVIVFGFDDRWEQLRPKQ